MELDKNRIRELFKSGVPIDDIVVEFNTTWSKIYQIVSTCLPIKIELTNSTKEEIKDLYMSGMSCPKIGIKYGVHHKCISRVLDEFDIPREQNGVRKWSLNKNYFDLIDTPNKAYILGLLYSDGNNCPSKGTIRIQLAEDDRDILEKINFEIGNNRPLKIVDCSKRVYGNGYVSKNMVSLDWYSSHYCEILSYYGVVPNKSLILTFPDFLDNELCRHFLRGYYDGDGSIYSHLTSKGYTQETLTITSTLSFCQTALDVIRQNTGIGGNIYDASCHNGVTSVISIGGRNQCKKVLDWFYYDSDLYLQRKYDRYINYFYSKTA